jgi:hypothetical protein
MKKWEIPVTWEVFGKVVVEADTLAEAMHIARDEEEILPLPDESDYVDGSWRITEEDEDFIRTYYNNNQQDDGEAENEKQK